MATITQNITIDVARANVFDAVIGKQYDEDSRFLKCSITQEGEPLTIPSGSSIAINAKRPDGTMGSFAGTRGADGTAIVPISSWILEQNGMVNLSVSIVGSGGEKLTSCTFYLNVQEAEGEGYILVYTAPSSVATGTYYITLGGVSYQFDLTTALATGDKIYFSSTYATGKTVDGSDGSTIETFTLTEGTSGTELVGSDVINFLASFMANIAELGNKADKVGESPDLVAGTAEQIIGEEFIDNKVPYSFRQTPGSGKRLAEEVVGATVAWNQLLNWKSTTVTGISASVDSDGVTTLSGLSTSSYSNITSDIQSVVGHKYLVVSRYIANPSNFTNIYWGMLNVNSSPSFSNKKIGSSSIVNITAVNGSFTGLAGFAANTDFSGTKIQIICIDLTSALGQPIADYLYTLESNTPGAGVAKFRELFPADYYAYCEPTLQSVCVSEHREYGVNAWDEEWELGTYNLATGAKTAATNIIRSKNAIQCLPNTEYYFGSYVASALFYDESGGYLSYAYNTAPGNLLTTPNGCYEVRFACKSAYGTTYNHDICINISNPLINGKYYPYSLHSYPLEAVELRGVLRLDGNNEIYADGDTYEGDGTVTRRYFLLDMGTRAWTREAVDDFYVFSTTAITNKALNYNFICQNYVNAETYRNYLTDKQCGCYNNSNARNRIVVRDDSYTDAGTFRTAMSGVYLVYELATPTTESAAPYPPLQHCSGGGTEEYMDYLVGQGTRDVSIPAGHNSKYYPDLTQRISDIPEPPSGDGTYTLKCTVSSGVRTFGWV